MSHRTTLSDLIAAIAKNMTTAELAKAVVNIQIQQRTSRADFCVVPVLV